MNRTVKLISIIAAVVMLLTIMAGCGTAKQESTTTAAPASTTAGQTSDAAKADSWTLDTSPLEINWYVSASDFNSTFDPAVTFAAKVLQEKTGIKINFSFPVGGDEDEKINTMIASNSLPDVVSVGQTSPQFGLLQQGGLLQPLNKLIDQYAPGFKDIIPKSMAGWYTYNDGNMYGFPCMYTAYDKLTQSDSLATNSGINARQEIMDKLGITADDFKTEEGMLAALKKVKDGNIEYNGKKVIPLWIGYDVCDDVFWYASDFYNINDEQKDGTFGNRYKDPGYLKILKFINKLYNEGLMSKENFTGTYDTQAEKATSGQVFCFMGCIGDYLGPCLDLYRNDKNVKWTGVGPLNGMGTPETYLHSSSMSGWLASCISQNAKNPDRIIRLFNYLYSEEGQDLTTVGVEGQTFTVKDGKAVLNPDIKAEFEENSDKALLKYGFSGTPENPGILWFMYDRLRGARMKPLPSTPIDQMWADNFAFFNKYAFSNMPFEGLNPQGGSDEAAILAQVNKLRPEMMAKALISPTPEGVEKEWNSFLAQTDALGYDKVIKVMNDKFQANKKKLGLDFAYPGNK